MESFSDRMGITNSVKEIQLDSMDAKLLIGIWNLFYTRFVKLNIDFENNYFFEDLYMHLDLHVDKISSNPAKLRREIKEKVFRLEWFEVYNLMEFLINDIDDYGKTTIDIKMFNKVLEKEYSAFRIIEKKVVPISNEIEVNSIEKSLQDTGDKFEGANNHIKTAMAFLSDKENPSYRNSIKESISAVESIARKLTGEKTLGKALAQLEQKGLQINSQLKEAFNKLYAYTNSPDNGVRHAIMEEVKEPDFDDAKYMLVSCSAFINYLIGKQAKHTI